MRWSVCSRHFARLIRVTSHRKGSVIAAVLLQIRDGTASEVERTLRSVVDDNDFLGPFKVDPGQILLAPVTGNTRFPLLQSWPKCVGHLSFYAEFLQYSLPPPSPSPLPLPLPLLHAMLDDSSARPFLTNKIAWGEGGKVWNLAQGTFVSM